MRRITEFEQVGVIEQLYLKADRSGAVIILEAQRAQDAQRKWRRSRRGVWRDELRCDRAGAGAMTVNRAASTVRVYRRAVTPRRPAADEPVGHRRTR
jgi:hypothetical protein